jgi:hypothetical protein
MAESAGRYCPLCGEAAGLMDRSCRRCGESLRVPGEGRVPAEGTDVQTPRRERSRLRRGFCVRHHRRCRWRLIPLRLPGLSILGGGW